MAGTDETVEPTAAVEPATERFRRHVGPIADTRPEPALARAVGAAAAVAGAAAIVTVAGEVVTDGGSEVLAAAIAAAYGVTGALLAVRGAPSQRTSGVTALAASIPGVFGLLLLTGSVSRSDVTLSLALSTIVWASAYLAGPTRGHPVLGALVLLGLWATVMTQVAADSLVLFAPGVGVTDGVFVGADTGSGAIVSLAFGAGYLLAADGLDRAGLRGVAVLFAAAALVALVAGLFLATVGRPEWLGGLLVTVAGALVALVGARRHGRLSTWAGAGATVVGLAVLTTAAVPGDDAVPEALAVLVVAAAVALLVPTLATSLGEGPD